MKVEVFKKQIFILNEFFVAVYNDIILSEGNTKMRYLLIYIYGNIYNEVFTDFFKKMCILL